MPNSANSGAPINALPLPLEDVGASTATAGSLSFGTSVYGTIDTANDRDWYAIKLNGGTTYTFRLLGVGGTPVEDTTLTLRDRFGAVLASSDDAGGAFGNNAVITYNSQAGRYYYLDAGAANSGTGDFIITAVKLDDPLKTVLSADEVAWQLTNNFERYFNYDTELNVPATAYDLSDGRTLSYNITQLSAAGQVLAVQALQMWSDVTGINFAATNGVAELNFDDSDTDVNAYNSNVTLTDGRITSSALMISTGWLQEFGTTLNSYSFETTLHELGHALGLGHGGNYNGTATYGVDNFYANDSQHLSIMSYMQSDHDEFARDSVDYNTFSNAQFRWVLTPMIADILAMGNLYGLSSTTRTGNTSYGYNSNTGNAALDAAVTLNDPGRNNYVAFTIFDNGGTDTVDMSGYAGAQRIDLQQGASSDVLGGRLNMGIAYGTEVENAYGGGGDDNVQGNASDNVLRGAAGTDYLSGEAGNDTLEGGAGSDRLLGDVGSDMLDGGGGRNYLYGGAGNDTLRVSAGSLGDDVYGGGGIDTLDFSGLSGQRVNVNMYTHGYTLSGGQTYVAQEMENVQGAALNDTIVANDRKNLLVGMAGDDSISGNGGDDTLIGGDGRDTLIGGSGADTYYVDGNDVIVETDALFGHDEVYSTASLILGANLEVLNLIGPVAIVGGGNDKNNQIFGNEGSNVLDGAGSGDELFGGAGNDTLYGASGSDRLVGGAGNDTLNGEALDAGFDPVAGQVYRLYQAVLDRAPDQAGHIGWANKIISGNMTLQQVANSFVASAEFQSHYGATSTAAFVTLLYENVLDRAPDSGGFESWTAALNSGRMTRAQVAAGFSESAEFAQTTATAAMEFSRAGHQANWGDEVYRLYQATLARVPDIAGFQSWTNELAQGRSLLSVVDGFTGSAEFTSLYGATTNSAFVSLLYLNVLNRDADAGGLASWTSRLESGALSRAEVVSGFASSAEFVRATASDFLDYMRFFSSDANDQLEAGTGDDLMFGGLGSDRFVFEAADTGHHRVVDLEAWDTIEMSGFGYANATDLRAHLTQVGDDVVFADRGVFVIFTETVLDSMGTSFLGFNGW